MVFSSVTFLFYFLPLFLLAYYLTPPKYRNNTLLFGSIIFYCWGGPVFIFSILLTTTFDYVIVKSIERADSKSLKKRLLILSLCINLGVLFSFKYLNFFVNNINILSGWVHLSPINIPSIVLPIGISFFTFESLTYVIDVYRGEYKSLSSFRNYLTYIIMFPKLIAGPIIPYNKIGYQIEAERKTTAQLRLTGFMRFIFGLSKKVLIANILGETVNEIYKLNPDSINSTLAWAAAIGYTLQIYFDFSGYSDMAIGLGEMLGFRIPENFNFPYISKSITEYWKRWHISLGNWMRNYLYIPLGGNKQGMGRTYFNLWFVFVVSGFWHGAGWNFIIWGAYHGLFLMIERLFLLRYLKKNISIIYTFIIVCIGFVLFRNTDIDIAFRMYKKMFAFDFHSSSLLSSRFLAVLILSLILSFIGVIKPIYNIMQDDERLFVQNNFRLNVLYFLALLSFVLSASYLLAEGFNPFIYFRF